MSILYDDYKNGFSTVQYSAVPVLYRRWVKDRRVYSTVLYSAVIADRNVERKVKSEKQASEFEKKKKLMWLVSI